MNEFVRNPKQEGSNLWDCIPQKGPCPKNCNQCFYNRPGAFYAGMEPLIPDSCQVRDGIVRMNCGHDSNISRDLVIETAKKYKHFFFNTSIPRFDFPGPVVFTANAKEEEYPFAPGRQSGWLDCKEYLDNLMFVRLRVSPTNLNKIEWGIQYWTKHQIPVVLTFMSYYDQIPPGHEIFQEDAFYHKFLDIGLIKTYVWKKRHINSYYCSTPEFIKYVIDRMKQEDDRVVSSRLVTMCGTLDSNWCRDCRNCETYYWQTRKHMREYGIR